METLKFMFTVVSGGTINKKQLVKELEQIVGDLTVEHNNTAFGFDELPVTTEVVPTPPTYPQYPGYWYTTREWKEPIDMTPKCTFHCGPGINLCGTTISVNNTEVADDDK